MCFLAVFYHSDNFKVIIALCLKQVFSGLEIGSDIFLYKSHLYIIVTQPQCIINGATG